MADNEKIADLVSYVTTLRKREGVTQVALEQRTGIKQSAIARLEAHRQDPSLSTFINIIDALGYEIVIVPKKF